MKYCTDCKHFEGHNGWHADDRCHHPDARTPVGYWVTAQESRAFNGACGSDAKLFEAMPVEAPRLPRPSIWGRIQAWFSKPLASR